MGGGEAIPSPPQTIFRSSICLFFAVQFLTVICREFHYFVCLSFFLSSLWSYLFFVVLAFCLRGATKGGCSACTTFFCKETTSFSSFAKLEKIVRIATASCLHLITQVQSSPAGWKGTENGFRSIGLPYRMPRKEFILFYFSPIL